MQGALITVQAQKRLLLIYHSGAEWGHKSIYLHGVKSHGLPTTYLPT